MPACHGCACACVCVCVRVYQVLRVLDGNHLVVWTVHHQTPAPAHTQYDYSLLWSNDLRHRMYASTEAKVRPTRRPVDLFVINLLALLPNDRPTHSHRHILTDTDQTADKQTPPNSQPTDQPTPTNLLLKGMFRKLNASENGHAFTNKLEQGGVAPPPPAQVAPSLRDQHQLPTDLSTQHPPTTHLPLPLLLPSTTTRHPPAGRPILRRINSCAGAIKTVGPRHKPWG